MQSKTIINLLNNENSRHFIGEHIKDSITELALSASKYPEIDIKAASQLISLYQKAKIKLPEHYKLMAALNKKSYEQCTSERVAEYKSRFMKVEGKEIVNLSGGLGVDDLAFARFASKVESCELDEDIHALASFNKDLYGYTHYQRFFTDGIEFIKQHKPVDIIYVDPDRRPNASRVFKLEDCEPDILSHLNLLMEKGSEVWIKLSPMADITYLERILPNMTKIAVIGWQEEVKEILVCCTKYLSVMRVERYAIRLTPKSDQIFKQGDTANSAIFDNEGNYLYEPDNTIIKAGLSEEYAEFLGLSPLGPQTHFYISDKLIDEFQGRVFKVMHRLSYKPKLITEYLKRNGIDRADITVRNFRETSSELSARFKIKQTGGNCLCFANDHQKQAWMYHVMPLNQQNNTI